MAAMPRARAIPGSLCGTARPDTKNVPESAFTAPVMILMSVLFPAPFSPTKAWTSPSLRSNEADFSACTPANALLMDFASSRRVLGLDILVLAEFADTIVFFKRCDRVSQVVHLLSIVSIQA